MLRIALPSDEMFLLLAPRWSGWGDAAQTIALVTLFLAPLALMLGLYRYELKLVSRRAAASLLLLRVVAVLVLWCLVGLQPTLAHVECKETPSRLLVAIDLSASMDLADPQRTWLEKLRLARALQLHDDKEALERWLKLAEDAELPKDGSLVALGNQVDRLPRKEIARHLLQESHRNLLGRLQREHHVDVSGFHEAIRDGNPAALADLLAPPDKSAGTPGTNLTLPFSRAIQPGSTSQGKLLGVIVLTDGQHNLGPAPLVTAKELAAQNVPVYAIGLGSKVPPIDLAVLDVQAPKQVFKDAEATVETRVRVSGLPAQVLTVELHGSGKFAKQEKTIQHDGTDRIHTATFPIKLDEVGTQRLEVRVRPQLPDMRETTTDNNRLATVIRVAPEKARVLIIEDEPRWEYHYLASALARDPDLLLDRVLFNQPRIGTQTQAELEKIGHARRQLPAVEGAKEDPLWQQDCIILGDVAPALLPPADRTRLEKYVADRGGTLVVVAGKRHMPLEYFSRTDDPLVKLLPLRQPSVLRPEDGFSLAITELGAKTPFFQIEKDWDNSRQRWAEMPKHFWGVAGTAKPGAVVLARAEHSSLPQAKDPSLDARGLVLQQPYGFGKVLYVGLESTWRWRYRVGDLYHHRFWGQLARWAVSDPWLPEGNRYVRFGAKAPIYRHDQEVELAARLGEEAPALAPATARVKVIRRSDDKEEIATTVPLVQDEQRPRQWTAKVKHLPPGAYRLELDVPELHEKLADPSPRDKPSAAHAFTVLPPEQGELIDVATNWDLLRSLAEQTKGRLFTVEDADQLPDLLSRQVERTESRFEWKLWQDAPMVWWVLGILLTLLTLEWTVRKLCGLP